MIVLNGFGEKPGDVGDDVLNVKQSLMDAGFPSPGEGNQYGTRTTAMVKVFQSRYNLPQTGIMGSKDWEALSGAGIDAKASLSVKLGNFVAGAPKAVWFIPAVGVAGVGLLGVLYSTMRRRR